MTPPAPASTARTATPEPKKRTKYDELVDVLAARQPQLGVEVVKRKRSGAARWRRLAFDVQ